MLRNDVLSAALPPDVRKGCAFPSAVSRLVEALPRPARGGSRRSLSPDRRETFAERHSLSAHQRAKPEKPILRNISNNSWQRNETSAGFMKAEIDENLKKFITEWAFRKERESLPMSILENPTLPEWLLSKITENENFRLQAIIDAKLYWEISQPFGFGMELFFPENIEIESFKDWSKTVQNFKTEMEYCERMEGTPCNRYIVQIKRLGRENGEWKIIEIFSAEEREQMQKFFTFMKDLHARKSKES